MKKISENTVYEPLPCLKCKKCTRHCPKNLDILKFIGIFNEIQISGFSEDMRKYFDSLPFELQPQNCSHCQMCEAVCPQKLKVSKMMMRLSDIIRRQSLN